MGSEWPTDVITTGAVAVPPRAVNQVPTNTLHLQPRWSANIPDQGTIARLHCRAATSGLLVDLDPCVLDHPAPALFLAADVSIEFFRRTRDHDQPLVNTKPFESLGLNGRCCRLVETVDDIGRSSGRREQTIPALRGIPGTARLRDGRQLRKCG